MAAEPRYRVDHVPGRTEDSWWVFGLVERGDLAKCWQEADANLIAAALNAAEDVGRWKAFGREFTEWAECHEGWWVFTRDTAGREILGDDLGWQELRSMALKAETEEVGT